MARKRCAAEAGDVLAEQSEKLRLGCRDGLTYLYTTYLSRSHSGGHEAVSQCGQVSMSMASHDNVVERREEVVWASFLAKSGHAGGEIAGVAVTRLCQDQTEVLEAAEGRKRGGDGLL